MKVQLFFLTSQAPIYREAASTLHWVRPGDWVELRYRLPEGLDLRQQPLPPLRMNRVTDSRYGSWHESPTAALLAGAAPGCRPIGHYCSKRIAETPARATGRCTAGARMALEQPAAARTWLHQARV